MGIPALQLRMTPHAGAGDPFAPLPFDKLPSTPLGVNRAGRMTRPAAAGRDEILFDVAPFDSAGRRSG